MEIITDGLGRRTDENGMLVYALKKDGTSITIKVSENEAVQIQRKDTRVGKITGKNADGFPKFNTLGIIGSNVGIADPEWKTVPDDKDIKTGEYSVTLQDPSDGTWNSDIYIIIQATWLFDKIKGGVTDTTKQNHDIYVKKDDINDPNKSNWMDWFNNNWGYIAAAIIIVIIIIVILYMWKTGMLASLIASIKPKAAGA